MTNEGRQVAVSLILQHTKEEKLPEDGQLTFWVTPPPVYPPEADQRDAKADRPSGPKTGGGVSGTIVWRTERQDCNVRERVFDAVKL